MIISLCCGERDEDYLNNRREGTVPECREGKPKRARGVGMQSYGKEGFRYARVLAFSALLISNQVTTLLWGTSTETGDAEARKSTYNSNTTAVLS